MKKQLPKFSIASKTIAKSLLFAQGFLDQAKNIQRFLLLNLISFAHVLTKNIIAGFITASFFPFCQNRIAI